MSPTQAAGRWAAFLREKHPLLRREGALALGVMGPGGRPFRDALVGLLGDTFPEVREAALLSLSVLGLPTKARDRVLALCKSAWPRERAAAWKAWGALEGKGQALEKQMWSVWKDAVAAGARGAVLRGLVRSGRRGRRIEREMLRALRGPDLSSVRWASRFWQKGRVPWEKTSTLLLSWTLSADASARLAVLEVLQRAEGVGGVREAFLRAMQDPNDKIRRLAGSVLVEEKWSAWRELLTRLARGDRALHQGVMEGLKAQGKKGWEKVRALLREQRDGLVRLGLQSLAVQGSAASSFCETIHGKMRVRHWSVRVEAVRALSKVCLGQADALRWLVGMLGDVSEEVRLASSQALADSPLSPLSFLKEASQSRSWRTRQAAARALGNLSAQVKEVRPLLLVLLRDQSWAVRRAAVEAMAKLGALVSSDTPKIKRLLRDEDRDVKRAAMRALVTLAGAPKQKRRLLLGWMERRGEKGLGLEALRSWHALSTGASRSEKRRVVGFVRRGLRRGSMGERQGLLRVLRRMGDIGRLVWPELAALVRSHHRPLQLRALRAMGAIDEPPASLVRSLLSWGAGKPSVKRRIAREVLLQTCSRILMPRQVWEPWLRHQEPQRRQVVLRCLERGGWRALPVIEAMEPLLQDQDEAVRMLSWRVWRSFGLWGSVGLRRLWFARPAGMGLWGKQSASWVETLESAGASLPEMAPFWLPKKLQHGVVKKQKQAVLSLRFRAMLASKDKGIPAAWWSCVDHGEASLRWSCARRLGKVSSSSLLLGALGRSVGARRVLLREALAQQGGGILSMALRKLAEAPKEKAQWLAYLKDEALWRGEGQGDVDPKLRGILQKLAGSLDVDIRRVAARAYLYWPQIGALDVARLVERLVEEDVEARRWIVSALLRQREKAIPALVSVLRRPQWAGTEFAIALLLKMGAGAVPSLREKLREGNAQERMYAVYALSEIGEPARSAKQEFLMALRDQQQDVQISAAFALCRLHVRSVQAEALLRRFLAHTSSEKRLAAARALARLYPLSKKTLSILAQRRKSEDALIRPVIFRALGRHLLLEAADVSELQEALKSTDVVTRRYAAKTLLLIAQSLELRCSAIKKEKCIQLRESLLQGEFLILWLKLLLVGDLPTQRSLLGAMMYLPRYTSKIVRIVLQMLVHKEADIRLLSVRLLGQIGLPAAGAVPRLMWLLRGDPEAEVRREAVRALAKLYALFLGVPRALKDASTDMDLDVAQEAQKALRDLQR
ncbi:MAG: HEAT repeat domain-containing protein [Myxococcales bacterium]|nr:HEAT repeat domain-containing protein [Myxococcales bacterium]